MIAKSVEIIMVTFFTHLILKLQKGIRRTFFQKKE